MLTTHNSYFSFLVNIYFIRLSKPGGKREFFREAKKPSVVVKDKTAPAYQVILKMLMHVFSHMWAATWEQALETVAAME